MQVLQDELEIHICFDAVKTLEPFSILEIGSANGGTLAFWLRTGAAHVVSIDADHSRLEWSELNAATKPGQQLHLVTGRSEDPSTIERLDRVMNANGIGRFDVAFIDGGHDYRSVKLDFMTCLARTAKVIILNDSTFAEVRMFLDELARVSSGWQMVSVVNPNRRLPCAGPHTCGSDFLVETGGGNCVVVLDPRHSSVLDYTRSRVEKELKPMDDDFEPTRRYFHERGLKGSPAYAAYWAGRDPGWERVSSRGTGRIVSMVRRIARRVGVWRADRPPLFRV
jgi:precorrin-6B methylase 2